MDLPSCVHGAPGARGCNVDDPRVVLEYTIPVELRAALRLSMDASSRCAWTVRGSTTFRATKAGLLF